MANIQSLCSILHCVDYTPQLITKVMFTLSSISRDLVFWSVNHTSVNENFEINLLKDIKFVGKISVSFPNNWSVTNVCKTLKSCW